ncbi:hypothetical protein EJB05_46572, partial [Eragrostis curvula]
MPLVIQISPIVPVRAASPSSALPPRRSVCPKLKFNGVKMCGKNICGKQKYIQNVINHVNAILAQCHGRVVEELAIKIDFDSMLVEHLNNWPHTNFSGFPNLKKLDLYMVSVSGKDLEELLSNCYNLEWLSIVRCHLYDELKVNGPMRHLLYLNCLCSTIFGRQTIRRLPQHPYNYLKDLLFTGFEGSSDQLEFLLYIVENAPALETLTVDRSAKM